ncbi:ABC transporter substrate-binding protein [Salibacterium salarium]|uniref:ABC transporter substrate-binding protein n=1 Tax=Salibacterium salarium TaxID=284579 RepID=A0A3R9NYX4_9BACI|nr:zinc ABC transporter substrate-binding protein [Salibacterium salarium]RSL29190.1 ABC transporter substrate-binding protein [Salibacterium salarium]
MAKKRCTLILLVMFTVLFIAACTGEEQNMAEKEESGENQVEALQIYTTLFVWEDFAEKIGGEEVEAENIIPAGADPHSFEPTSQTMIDIAESDLFMLNGAGMEGFADAVDETMEKEGVSSLEVTSGMDLIGFQEEHNHSHNHTDEHNHDHGEEHGHDHGEGNGHNHGDVDPHIWLDPVRSMKAVDNIKDKLIDLRPEREDFFEENAAELKNELEALDKTFTEMADAAENQQFIVSHAAYGYWEERYGLEQIGVSGLSPSDEPSQKELKSIIDTVEEANISHVMFEQNVSSKVTEVLQEEVGAEALQLHNLSVRTEEERENNEDYFQLMRQNIDNLDTALTASGNSTQDSNGSDSEALDITVEGAEEHYHIGNEIELTYNIEGETESEHVHWFEKGPEAEEAEVVDGEEMYTATASEELKGMEVSVAMYNDDHEIIAQSEPIVIHIDNHNEEHGHEEEHSHSH